MKNVGIALLGLGVVGSGTYRILEKNKEYIKNHYGVEIEVIVLEPTGSETQVIGRIGTQSINGIFRERINAAPGSKLKVMPDLSVVHLFNKAGQRVN